MSFTFELVDPLPCDRCAGEPYLTVRVPHPGYLYPELQPQRGMMTFSLCPRCDAGNPKAHGMLAYFAYHSTVEAGGLDGFASLLEEWLRSLRQPGKVDPAKFEEDVKAYWRGEFD